MNKVDKRIQSMLDWCDKIAVKWKKNGTKKVTPIYKYNNHNCTKNGGYCHICKPRRKKAFFCNSAIIAAWVHGYKIEDKNFKNDCLLWKGGGCGGQMRRDFNPAVKKGEFVVLKEVSKSKPIFCNTATDIRRANKILRPGDVLMIARSKKVGIDPKASMCHTAMWYGNGLIFECAGDAGTCIRTAKKIDRGQNRRIVKVYRKTGQSDPENSPGGKSKKKSRKTYSGKWPTLPKRGYFKLGDGKKKGLKNVEYVQKFLKWCGYDLAVDGYYGPKTREAVKKFQKAHGLAKDGCFGRKTLAKAKTIKK